MKTRPSSLPLPCVTAALVHGRASTSLLLHPCLATANELIQLKLSSLPVNTQKWRQKLLPPCCSTRQAFERAFRWTWSQSVCLHPLSFCQRGKRREKKKSVCIYIPHRCSLISVGCWMCVCASSKVSAIKHLPVLEGKRFFSVCSVDSETCLSCRKSGRINFEYFDIQQWKSSRWHGDLRRLSASFFLAFYAPRSWAWLTDCNFSPGNSLLRLNPKSSWGIVKPGPALLKNQAAGCRREIHGAKLDSDDQILSSERLGSSQPELPKTEAQVKPCPPPRCISPGGSLDQKVHLSGGSSPSCIGARFRNEAEWVGRCTCVSFWWQGRRRKCW